MKKLLALFALLLLAATAQAYTCTRTFYFSDCQTGADAACVAGANGNAGTIGSPKQTTSGITQTPGDCYLFANGGAWSGGISSAAGTSGSNPLVWDNYVPSWCTGGCTSTTYPKRNITSGNVCFSFSDGSGADHDEGYYVAHHECIGSGGAGSSGIFIYNDADYITFDSLNIHGFEIGFYCGIGNSSPAPSPGANLINEKIQFLRSTVYENTAQGALTNCDHLLIEGNSFHDNGIASPTFDHNLYISGNANQNVTVRFNTIYNQGLTGGAGTCQGTSFVAHGVFNKLLVEYNYVYETVTTTASCFLLSISTRWANTVVDGFVGTIIRGNLIVNGGGNAIELEGCQQCVLEDNSVVYTTVSGFDHVGMRIQTNTGSNSDPDYTCSNGLIVRNNSIYLSSATANSIGIINECEGTGHIFVNNLVYMGASSSASASCFSTGAKTETAYATWDRNLCFRSGGVPTWVKVNGSAKSLAQAQALGLDTNGISSDPLFVATPSSGNGWSLDIQTGSPAKNAGNTTYKSRGTRDGKVRTSADSSPDIGSFEYGATAVMPGGVTRFELN